MNRLSAKKILHAIRTKKNEFWLRERESRALRLFHKAATRVPAYRDFLKKNKINPEKIKNFKDFQGVPPISKNNYLCKYPLEELCWDGSLKKPLVWTATSGSTGQPFYFPRGEKLDWEYSILAEIFLQNGFRDKNSDSSTLVIIGFGMGVWIGGVITYKAFEIAARRGNYPVSIITPGINKKEIFNALKTLAPHFSRTVLIGYPPFVKDVLDEAEDVEKINLKKLNIRILTAAEAYTEKFRDYLAKKAGVGNICLDMLNIYGTADIGAMAWETPTAILMRRLAVKNQKLFKSIFPFTNKTPTLAQYNPLFITFEAPEDEILLTGDNSLPLIRYAVGDRGGVLGFNAMLAKFSGLNIGFAKEARKANISNNIYQLPFVYVYERTDFAVKLHLRDIYPETIKDVLVRKPFSDLLTGKFAMSTKYNRKHDQYLDLNIELKKNSRVNRTFETSLRDGILKSFRINTSGPGDPLGFIKRPNLVALTFWPPGHPLHFKPGVKQRWVEK